MIVWSRYQNGTYALGFATNIWLNANTTATVTVFGSGSSYYSQYRRRARR